MSILVWLWMTFLVVGSIFAWALLVAILSQADNPLWAVLVFIFGLAVQATVFVKFILA